MTVPDGTPAGPATSGAEAPGRLLELHDAIVTPTAVDRERKTFTGCVYDRDGALVRAAQRTASNVTWKPADPIRIEPPARAARIDADCVYLGHYTAQYGHFLLETLSRFWALGEAVPRERVLFHPFLHPTPRPRSFSPARVAFACFDIDPRQMALVRRATRVSRLFVPESLVEINNRANPRQREVYGRIATCCVEGGGGPAPRRIYLSRRRWKRYRTVGTWRGYRPFTNEDEVEGLFGSLGFEVIHPERLAFAEQVAMYRAAEVAAGYPSSALHNAVFMRPGTLVIKVGSLRARSVANPNQRMCEELGGVRSEFLPFEGRVVDWKKRLGEVDLEQLRKRVERLLP